MNKFAKLVVGLALVSLPVIGVIGTAFADTPPANAAPGSTLAERVDQRKKERVIVLDKNDNQRLISTCESAQGKLRVIQTNAVATLQRHIKVYKNVDGRLWLVTGRLKLATQDTFQLEKQHLEYTDKVAAFQTTVTNYEQALDDTVVINCAADTIGFKALLDTTRLYYDQLAKQSADIREYVINNIKPTLASHVTDLQPKSAPTAGAN